TLLTWGFTWEFLYCTKLLTRQLLSRSSRRLTKDSVGGWHIISVLRAVSHWLDRLSIHYRSTLWLLCQSLKQSVEKLINSRPCRMHMVNWEEVSEPKELGGLGIKRMEELGRALNDKLVSWFLNNKTKKRYFVGLALHPKGGESCSSEGHMLAIGPGMARPSNFGKRNG
ncbi:hypothetical protein V2J09_003459, partial [Rumex salicifolius]